MLIEDADVGTRSDDPVAPPDPLTTAFEGLIAEQLARIADLHREIADLGGRAPRPPASPGLSSDR
jgi:hypothetical protein